MSEWSIKRERDESCSVPIPRRADSCELTFDLELSGQEPFAPFAPFTSFSQPDLYRYDTDLDQLDQLEHLNTVPKCEPFKMEDDDDIIFQVDKADLIQGPTLAELNANDDTLLGDLNFDDLLLPEENSFYLQIGDSMSQSSRSIAPSLQIHPPAAPQPSPIGFNLSQMNCVDAADTSSPMEMFQRHHAGAFSPVSGQSSHPSSLQSSQHGSPCLGLQELLTSPSPRPIITGLPHISTGGPRHRHLVTARLSSSAPAHPYIEQVWQRREPRKHLLSTGSLAEAGSTSSLSTGGVLSPGAHEDLSQDEDTDEDSDKYEDYSSDGDSDAEEGNESKSHRKRTTSKTEKYFWQYNIQAKGPKGQRLVLKTKLEDPHVLNEVTDPVFSPSCSLRGIKHSGKARKGDGNDLTPNPKKLFIIGKELDNLGRIINDMTPVSELPFNVRPKTRKEKNKLASRACRLKKKAQHEANKLKLYGLQQEHKQLLHGISQMKEIIVTRLIDKNPISDADLKYRVDEVVKNATKIKIAGHSSEYVNKILDKVKAGVPDGGMKEF